MSNNVTICRKRGLHSVRLLPHFPALKAHLEALESVPAPSFSKPPHLGPLSEGLAALEDACELQFGHKNGKKPRGSEGWDSDWRLKVRVGYERVSQTLWRVAKEFDIRGYGIVLREKLTSKWCDCGCSTDHLGEVCEKTVREDEEENGVRPGKEREWDGRGLTTSLFVALTLIICVGAGIYGWETEEEEDVWDVDLDFNGMDPDSAGRTGEPDMTISELMEWRYLRAEKEKEQVSFLTQYKSYLMSDLDHREIPHSARGTIKTLLSITLWHMKLSLNFLIISSTLLQHRSNSMSMSQLVRVFIKLMP